MEAMAKCLHIAVVSLAASILSLRSSAADWKSIKPALTSEKEVIAQFGVPDEVVATFPWSEWSARWKIRPLSSHHTLRYRSDVASSDLLVGPGGKADSAEVFIGNDVVQTVTWSYGGPSARAASEMLRADTEMHFSPSDSPSYGSKAVPNGRVFVEFDPSGSSLRVVYDLK
jgi:hypothetical protein